MKEKHELIKRLLLEGKTLEEIRIEALARLHKLETALQKIKFSNDTINEVLGKN